MDEGVTITLVTKDQHCASCTITERMVKEVLAELKQDHPEIAMKLVQLGPEQECTLPEVKIHQFPAIVINGKQVTAGSVIAKKQIEELIR